jgi:pyruvyltransferase
MESKINLVYWSERNFGDALSPLLIEEFSVLKTQLKHAYKSKIRRFFKAVLKLSTKEFNTILFPWQENVLGVGSVICSGNAQSSVWGSGFMNDAGKVEGKTVLAVRGPLTAERLVKQGFPKCETYGDPALLLPLWLPPAATKKHKIGIVPHWKETDLFLERYEHDFMVVDLRTRDVKRVVQEITSCDYILSTSLHGLIVAHAYNIPALWIKEGYIETDGFKFADYLSSVGIPVYEGFEVGADLANPENYFKELLVNHPDKSLPLLPLEALQKGLLKVAPFPLKTKYLNMIKTQ